MTTNELQPVFTITVRLDGDDYPPTATASVKDALEGFLTALVDSRLIRKFTLELQQ